MRIRCPSLYLCLFYIIQSFLDIVHLNFGIKVILPSGICFIDQFLELVIVLLFGHLLPSSFPVYILESVSVIFLFLLGQLISHILESLLLIV